MPSLDESFKAVGVTSARDKILALCNAPALFFDVKLPEDSIMVSLVAPYAGRTLLEELLPAQTSPYDFGLVFSDLHKHIMNSVFQHPDIAKRRNLSYAMQDPAYLDNLIAWIKDVRDKYLASKKAHHEQMCSFLVAETEFPLLKFNDDYRKFYEKETRQHS